VGVQPLSGDRARKIVGASKTLGISRFLAFDGFSRQLRRSSEWVGVSAATFVVVMSLLAVCGEKMV
jgi:hypothetical protein